MRRLRRMVMDIARAEAPLGRLLRLRIKLTVDNVITLAIALFAVATTTAYQAVRWRTGRTGRR